MRSAISVVFSPRSERGRGVRRKRELLALLCPGHSTEDDRESPRSDPHLDRVNHHHRMPAINNSKMIPPHRRATKRRDSLSNSESAIGLLSHISESARQIRATAQIKSPMRSHMGKYNSTMPNSMVSDGSQNLSLSELAGCRSLDRLGRLFLFVGQHLE